MTSLNQVIKRRYILANEKAYARTDSLNPLGTADLYICFA